METIIDLIKSKIKRVILKKCLIFLANITIDPKDIAINVEKTKNITFGDFSVNTALTIGFKDKEKIMKFATAIAKHLSKMKYFEKATAVFPGFINITISQWYYSKLFKNIIKKNENYGLFKKKKLFYNIEFVSANPTGLIHIAHARNAAVGATLVNIFEHFGIKVNKEYYINDGGNQIEKLALSVFIRYKQQLGENTELPEDSYHGLEIIDVAKLIVNEKGNIYQAAEFSNEKILDDEAREFFKSYSTKYMLDTIKQTLLNYNIEFDIWFHESSIYEKNLIPYTLEKIKDYLYEKDGALWLKTTEHGDDKDRVIKKTDGSYTYFAPDIAYHYIKLSRGYDKCFNIWGADHKSYAERMNIAIQLLGFKKEQLITLIQQMIRIMKNGEEVKLSKRSGNSFTAQDFLDAVGKDAARWFLISQSLDTHLDIDIEKATKKDNSNPLFYVQYAHARINQLNKKCKYDKISKFDLLTLPIEKELMNIIISYKSCIETIAKNYEVHRMIQFLTNLAKQFHSFYSNNKIIDPASPELSKQRYWLCQCVKIIIANGLRLLDITPVDEM